VSSDKTYVINTTLADWNLVQQGSLLYRFYRGTQIFFNVKEHASYFKHANQNATEREYDHGKLSLYNRYAVARQNNKYEGDCLPGCCAEYSVVWQKFADVSEVLAAFIIRVIRNSPP
jgi:hypothetical protein